jgi:hypothetical protein
MADTPENAIREWQAHPSLEEAGGKPLPFRVVENTIGFVKKRGAPDRQLGG